MNIYVLGNPFVESDNGPIRMLPNLIKAFPNVSFIEVDPTENFIPEHDSLIIDTVQGISSVQLFEGIDAFSHIRSVSAHDFDLGLHLGLLRKLHKVSTIRILGIAPNAREKEVTDILKTIL